MHSQQWLLQLKIQTQNGRFANNYSITLTKNKLNFITNLAYEAGYKGLDTVRKQAKNMIAMYLGQFYLIQQVLVICIAKDAGQENMERNKILL